MRIGRVVKKRRGHPDGSRLLEVLITIIGGSWVLIKSVRPKDSSAGRAKVEAQLPTTSFLNRPSTGSLLENVSKLLQVLAVVVGASWVLMDYIRFKDRNNELTNQHAELNTKLAALQITTASLTNDMSRMRIDATKKGKFEVKPEISLTRQSRTLQADVPYRFFYRLELKNASETDVNIQAWVVEFFVGAVPKELSGGNEAIVVNQPASIFERRRGSGAIDWRPAGKGAQIILEAHPEVFKELKGIDLITGDSVGDLRPGETTEWGTTLLFRASPDDLVGAVMSIFYIGQDDTAPRRYPDTRYELLSDAEDGSPHALGGGKSKASQTTGSNGSPTGNAE